MLHRAVLSQGLVVVGRRRSVAGRGENREKEMIMKAFEFDLTIIGTFKST